MVTRMEEFAALVPESVRHLSGSVFYSGRSAFENPSPIYILGLNPGGDPAVQSENTVERQMQSVMTKEEETWSAYVDDSWEGKKSGTYKMQPRIQHLCQTIGRNARDVPASNVIFVRSAREAALLGNKDELIKACWPMHEAVTNQLDVQIVVCLGSTAGEFVRKRLATHRLIDCFEEQNDRRWTSTIYASSSGLKVVTLTHPSIAAWNKPATDPTPMVLRHLT